VLTITVEFVIPNHIISLHDYAVVQSTSLIPSVRIGTDGGAIRMGFIQDIACGTAPIFDDERRKTIAVNKKVCTVCFISISFPPLLIFHNHVVQVKRYLPRG